MDANQLFMQIWLWFWEVPVVPRDLWLSLHGETRERVGNFKLLSV